MAIGEVIKLLEEEQRKLDELARIRRFIFNNPEILTVIVRAFRDPDDGWLGDGGFDEITSLVFVNGALFWSVEANNKQFAAGTGIGHHGMTTELYEEGVDAGFHMDVIDDGRSPRL